MKPMLGALFVLVALSAVPAFADDAFRERSLGPTEEAHRAQGIGLIKSLDKDGRHVVLSHGAIPEMVWPASERRLAVANPELLRGLRPGQKVRFTINDAGLIIVLQPVQ